MGKAKLRSLMKENLSELFEDEASINLKNSLLAKNLLQLLSDLNVIQNDIVIGAFAPLKKEPELAFLRSTQFEKLLAFPTLDPKDAVMVFKKARFSDLILKAEFGPKILGPDKLAKVVVPGVILIPGLGFSQNGNRVGKGKGFYDKYLSNYRGVKIGVCFSVQLTDLVPTEEHDIPMDFIVTEEKVFKCIRA